MAAAGLGTTPPSISPAPAAQPLHCCCWSRTETTCQAQLCLRVMPPALSVSPSQPGRGRTPAEATELVAPSQRLGLGLTPLQALSGQAWHCCYLPRTQDRALCRVYQKPAGLTHSFRFCTSSSTCTPSAGCVPGPAVGSRRQQPPGDGICALMVIRQQGRSLSPVPGRAAASSPGWDLQGLALGSLQHSS